MAVLEQKQSNIPEYGKSDFNRRTVATHNKGNYLTVSVLIILSRVLEK